MLDVTAEPRVDGCQSLELVDVSRRRVRDFRYRIRLGLHSWPGVAKCSTALVSGGANSLSLSGCVSYLDVSRRRVSFRLCSINLVFP